MTRLDKLLKEWWAKTDLSLPNWALEQDWNTYVQDAVSEETGPLCDHCKAVLAERRKITRKILSGK